LSSTLVTGAGGFIGGALVSQLAAAGEKVVGLTRSKTTGPHLLTANFASPEDLRALDDVPIDRVCHLAAVTGGCTEEDGLEVNVVSTRAFLRHMIDRGCKKFVLASSIAVVGLADSDFLPQSLPIREGHPCLASDAYGLSKYLMEEVGRYLVRADDVEITVLRLCSVFPDKDPPPKVAGGRPETYALASVTKMPLTDAVAAFRRALDTDLGSGFRLFNAGPREAWTAIPTAELFERWYGTKVDPSFYGVAGRRFGSPFDVTAIEESLGFAASV
jgi:nucleoside-diphosphate-sugar epimerase